MQRTTGRNSEEIRNQSEHGIQDQIETASSERIEACLRALTGIQDPEGAIAQAREALEAGLLVFEPRPFLDDDPELPRELPPPFQCNFCAQSVDSCDDDCLRAKMEAALAKLSAISPAKV